MFGDQRLFLSLSRSSWIQSTLSLQIEDTAPEKLTRLKSRINFSDMYKVIGSTRALQGLHALWYIRVSDTIPVLELKGFLSTFEYSVPLHPPLTPIIQYWGTLMRANFPVLNTLWTPENFQQISLTIVIFIAKGVIFGQIMQ